MEKYFVEQWNKNKAKIEAYFRATDKREISYETIVTKLFELVVTEIQEGEALDPFEMDVIDHGDCEGSQLFIIPSKAYQPYETQYVVTHNRYGSCSGCDTLLRITNGDSGLADEKQVAQYMTLCLHLVQRAKRLYSFEESELQDAREEAMETALGEIEAQRKAAIEEAERARNDQTSAKYRDLDQYLRAVVDINRKAAEDGERLQGPESPLINL